MTTIGDHDRLLTRSAPGAAGGTACTS